MKKIRITTMALTTIVIAVTFFFIIAQAGPVSDFYAYKSCVNDSECDDDGYCIDGKCKKSEELKSCVDDSECGGDGVCVNGKCIKSKDKKGCVDDSDCDDDGYCVEGQCQKAKKW